MAKATTIHPKDKAAAASPASDAGRPTLSEAGGIDAAAAAPEPEPSLDAAGAASSEASAATKTKVTKLGRIRALLGAPGGASLPALCGATGWQSHSVRAALTGLRKAGHAVEKAKAEDGTTVYRIAPGSEVSK